MRQVLLFVLMILVSCFCYAETSEGYQTFVIYEENGMHQLQNLLREKSAKRAYFQKYLEEQERLDKCLKKITKNWKRTIDGETIIGYDGQIDRDFRERIWLRIRKGERICAVSSSG